MRRGAARRPREQTYCSASWNGRLLRGNHSTAAKIRTPPGHRHASWTGADDGSANGNGGSLNVVVPLMSAGLVSRGALSQQSSRPCARPSVLLRS